MVYSVTVAVVLHAVFFLLRRCYVKILISAGYSLYNNERLVMVSIWSLSVRVYLIRFSYVAHEFRYYAMVAKFRFPNSVIACIFWVRSWSVHECQLYTIFYLGGLSHSELLQAVSVFALNWNDLSTTTMQYQESRRQDYLYVEELWIIYVHKDLRIIEKQDFL